MAINQAQIDEVINKANIADIIGKYLDIQKKGRNYLAVCPFHDDKDPSLHIAPSKKIFKCFVCGVGGNVITFVQEFNNTTFFKALNIVASTVKVKIDGLKNLDDRPRFNNAEARVLVINNEAAKFFNAMLITKSAKLAREYLMQRGIKKSEISKFHIGFVPKDMDLKQYLLKKGFELRDLENSKLFSSKGTKEWNFFENRIVFPIWDNENNIIGFSGRAFQTGDEPKYKNSIENIVFKKSQLAYNFANAINHIRVANEIVILEGFMDVISLERIGIKNSVAIMGTNLSDYHVKLFSKVTKNFKLFLDGDKAGVSAALKTAVFLMDRNINVSIIENKTNQDPDELVVQGNKNLVEEMIFNARHPLDFAMEYYLQFLNKNNSTSLAEYVKKIVEIIEHERDAIIKTTSINRLAKISGVEIDEINKLIKTVAKVEVVHPEATYRPEEFDYNNLWVDQTFENKDVVDDFIIHTNINQNYESDFLNPEAQNYETVKLNVSHSTQQKNLFSERRKRAESLLLVNLVGNSANLEVIKNNLELFTNFSYMKVIQHIISMYEKNEYQGNSLETIQTSLAKVKGLSESPLYETKNRLDFTKDDKHYSIGGINDMLDTIKLYKLWARHDDTLRKMIKTTDYQAKIILHELCDKIMQEIRTIMTKKEERNK
ncbi:DNA primase [Spiroplasma clarkii]|uniref:DNA primase n=1 Tax=Spiroplasma clarkii TaxID=2139 RepID=A0A2K8KGS5_9MOLU|nr:DNA primase [Spiroplasma clarkii]ATX70878.1 DNA primase [Spiroplasma clarkii]